MSEYHNLCVNHQRYAAGLETGDPQSLHIHAMKCTTGTYFEFVLIRIWD
jgi:hypothetical protein